MKTVMMAALAGTMLISCAKSNREATNQIAGQWEHRKDEGGFAAVIHYPPGNGNKQVFGNNNELTILQADTVKFTGTYAIRASGKPQKWLLQLSYKINGQLETSTDTVQFAGNQLIYLPQVSCCDVPTRYYERVSDKP